MSWAEDRTDKIDAATKSIESPWVATKGGLTGLRRGRAAMMRIALIRFRKEFGPCKAILK